MILNVLCYLVIPLLLYAVVKTSTLVNYKGKLTMTLKVFDVVIISSGARIVTGVNGSNVDLLDIARNRPDIYTHRAIETSTGRPIINCINNYSLGSIATIIGIKKGSTVESKYNLGQEIKIESNNTATISVPSGVQGVFNPIIKQDIILMTTNYFEVVDRRSIINYLNNRPDEEITKDTLRLSFLDFIACLKERGHTIQPIYYTMFGTNKQKLRTTYYWQSDVYNCSSDIIHESNHFNKLLSLAQAQQR